MHAPSLAIAPNQNATLQFVLCTIHYVRTIVADCVGLFFWRRDENEILIWEFAKMFETMVGVELLEGYQETRSV